MQLGITQGAVSRYLNGKRALRKSLQQRLFEELGLNYATLDELSEDIRVDL